MVNSRSSIVITWMDLASVRITEGIFWRSQEQFREVSSDWNVIPSIFRNEEALRLEAESVQENIKDSKNDILITLFEMQYYGFPTTLLDLTISPLSALFFAADSEEQNKNDGVVYVIDRSQEHLIDSDHLHKFAENIIKTDEDIDDEGLVFQDYLIKYD